MKFGVILATTLVAALAPAAFAQEADPLPSWNGGKARQSIVDFVSKVAKEGTPDFVPAAERIATPVIRDSHVATAIKGGVLCPVEVTLAIDRNGIAVAKLSAVTKTINVGISVPINRDVSFTIRVEISCPVHRDIPVAIYFSWCR